MGINYSVNQNSKRTPNKYHSVPISNVGVKRHFSLWDKLVATTYYRFRYMNRAAMPYAKQAVFAATINYRVLLLTGRNWRCRSATETWLENNGFLNLTEKLIMNDTAMDPTQFKQSVIEKIGVVRHVDDDALTAIRLAQAGVSVDLIDWPRNRGIDLPDGVTRWLNLRKLMQDFSPQSSDF